MSPATRFECERRSNQQIFGRAFAFAGSTDDQGCYGETNLGAQNHKDLPVACYTVRLTPSLMNIREGRVSGDLQSSKRTCVGQVIGQLIVHVAIVLLSVLPQIALSRPTQPLCLCNSCCQSITSAKLQVRCCSAALMAEASQALATTAADLQHQQGVRDVQDMPSTSCPICMSDHLQNATKIQVCGHCFW